MLDEAAGVVLAFRGQGGTKYLVPVCIPREGLRHAAAMAKWLWRDGFVLPARACLECADRV
jgi:hypothetical protein